MATKVNYFILADYASVSQEQKVNILGIFDRVTADKFPAQHPRCVVISNLELPDGKHKIGLKILNPNKKEIIPPAAEKKFIEIDGGKKTNVITELNLLPLSLPGKYTIILVVDGEELASLTLEAIIRN